MNAATLFSGIGAPEVAMPSWRWLWHAEIEPFPSAVMAKRHRSSINLGDVTADDFTERALAIGRPDVLVFGSPCQSYSVAGKRLGLDDPRGNLALIALGIVERLAPRWFVFENVPGLFSSYSGADEAARAVREGAVGARAEGDEDSDFAAFLSTVRDIGRVGGWTVLDAQYAGLAQRRKRVFFVGCPAPTWQRAIAVLLEPESLCGHPPTRGEAREDVTGTLAARASAGGGLGTDFDLNGGVVALKEPCSKGDAGSIRNSIHAAPGDPMFTLGAESQHGVFVTGTVGRHHGNVRADQAWTGQLVPQAFGGNNTSGPVAAAAAAVNAKGGSGRMDFESETLITHSLRADGFDASEDGSGRGTPLVVSTKFDGVSFGSAVRLESDNRSDAGSAQQHAPSIAYAIGSHASAADGDQTNRSHAGGGPVGLNIQEELGYTVRAERPQAVAFNWQSGGDARGLKAQAQAQALSRSQVPAVFAVQEAQTGVREYDTAGALRANGPGHDPVGTRVREHSGVRRLMPDECELLQGFRRNYTLINYRGKRASDGPRYKAIGNSMAVPVIRWILERIDWLDKNVPQLEASA